MFPCKWMGMKNWNWVWDSNNCVSSYNFGKLGLFWNFPRSNSNYFCKWSEWPFCGNTYVAMARSVLILKGAVRPHASTETYKHLKVGNLPRYSTQLGKGMYGQSLFCWEGSHDREICTLYMHHSSSIRTEQGPKLYGVVCKYYKNIWKYKWLDRNFS